jgi:hypothetical protein
MTDVCTRTNIKIKSVRTGFVPIGAAPTGGLVTNLRKGEDLKRVGKKCGWERFMGNPEIADE